MSNKEVFYSNNEILVGKSRLHRMVSKSLPINKELITKKEYDLLIFLINEDVEYSSMNLFNELSKWFKVIPEN